MNAGTSHISSLSISLPASIEAAALSSSQRSRSFSRAIAPMTALRMPLDGPSELRETVKTLGQVLLSES